VTKNERTTKVLLQAGLDVETIGCSSLSAAVSADGILLGFLLLSSILVFQSASVPGLTSNEFPACSNTRTLAVILCGTLNLPLFEI